MTTAGQKLQIRPPRIYHSLYFFNPRIDYHCSELIQLPFFFRYCSTQQIQKSVDNFDVIDQRNDAAKHKGSLSLTRYGAMARLINKKPWTDSLQSSLYSLSPSVSQSTVLRTLKLIKTPHKALNFFNWVQDIGFIHNDKTYFKMLQILRRLSNLTPVRDLLLSIGSNSSGSVVFGDRLFNSLIRNYSKAGLFQESINVFYTMKQVGVPPSVITFNSLLSALLKHGRTHMAKSLFDEMLRTYGVTPDVYTFNILIRGFCVNSLVKEGFHYFKEMQACNCDPDVVTYNTLIDGLCRAGKIRTAYNVFKGMCKDVSVVVPNVVTYTTLIRAYCLHHDIDRAFDVFKEMNDHGLKPNEITFNTLVLGLCEAKKLDKIEDIFRRGDFTPDICTFNTIINVHCIVGNLENAMDVFGKLAEFQVLPDSVTYGILLRTLCLKKDFDRAERYLDELLHKKILLQDIGSKPFAAAYNLILDYLCSTGKIQKADVLFHQLTRRGTPDFRSYKTLIMGHCREGTTKAGYDLLVMMLRRDFVPDFETYVCLIDCLLCKNDPSLGFKVLQKMLKSCHIPNASTFHSVLKELLAQNSAEEAATLVILMLEKKIIQNISLSTKTVMLLFGRGLQDKACELLGFLFDNGYSVKIMELVGFLCSKELLLEAYRLLLLFLNKHMGNVNGDMCSPVIQGLCRIQKTSEAFSLYYELVEKGALLHESCLKELKTALKLHGKPKEAEFVAKRLPGVLIT